MEEKVMIPDSGCITAVGETPAWMPKVRSIKRGYKNRDNAPIEVKRTIRGGFRRLEPGESIDWREYYFQIEQAEMPD